MKVRVQERGPLTVNYKHLTYLYVNFARLKSLLHNKSAFWENRNNLLKNVDFGRHPLVFERQWNFDKG